jgi:hypothetical protein
MSPRRGSTPRWTDWLTDWPSVAMWSWLAATDTITLTSRRQHSSQSTPPATTGIHQASHRSRSFASAPLSLALASHSGSHRQANAEKTGRIPVTTSRSQPAAAGVRRHLSDAQTRPFSGPPNLIDNRISRLPAYSSVYSVNRWTFVIVLRGCLDEYRHPTMLLVQFVLML